MTYRFAGAARRIATIGFLLIMIGLSGCAPSGGGTSGSFSSFEVGDEVTVDGVVVENTINPCLFPGDVPCVEGIGQSLKVEADGYLIIVHYGGHHGKPCINEAANETAAGARVGASVKVFALVTFVDQDRLSLSVCESPDSWIEELEMIGRWRSCW